MTMFHFNAYLADLAEITDEAADRLYEAGCDDASIGSSRGQTEVRFHREAASLENAIQSAIDDIDRAGFRVSRVESEEALTIRRINEQLTAST